MWPWRRKHEADSQVIPRHEGRLLVLSTRGCRTQREAIHRTCLGLPVERVIDNGLDALADFLRSGLIDLGGRITIWHPRNCYGSAGGVGGVILDLCKEGRPDAEPFEDYEELRFFEKLPIRPSDDPHSLAAVIDATECEHHLIFILTTTHVTTTDQALTTLHAQLPDLLAPPANPTEAADNLAAGLGMLIAPDVTVWWENGQHDAHTPTGKMIHRILQHAAELAPHQSVPDITPTQLHIVLGPAPETTQQESSTAPREKAEE